MQIFHQNEQGAASRYMGKQIGQYVEGLAANLFGRAPIVLCCAQQGRQGGAARRVQPQTVGVLHRLGANPGRRCIGLNADRQTQPLQYRLQ